MFPFILDIKFVGRTSRGHTGGRCQPCFHRHHDMAGIVTKQVSVCTDDFFWMYRVLCFRFPGLDEDPLGSVIRFLYISLRFLPACRFSWISKDVRIVICEGPVKRLSLCPLNCADNRWCSTILL